MTRVMSTALLLGGLAIVASGCTRAPEPPPTPTSSTEPAPGPTPGPARSGYYSQEPGNTGVIVFIHGILGGVPGTWTNKKTGAFWPELIKGDTAFNGFDIYLYDFATPALGQALSIDELADDLHLELNAPPNSVLSHQEIIFLCHSMGGLIARAFLQKYQPVASKVRMIYFFSTPTNGAEIADIARFFSRNPQLGEMVPIKNEDYLSNQIRGWNAAQFPIASFCAYEAKTTHTTQVVSMASASALCNRRLVPLLLNHMDTVKPEDRQAKPYKAFLEAFNETRPICGTNLPAWELDLSSALKVVATACDNAMVSISKCTKETLVTKVAGGRLQGASGKVLLERLLAQVLGSPNQSRVSYDQGRRVYDVQCNR